MWYHVLIETNEKVGKFKENKQYFELDKPSLEKIIDEIIVPYLNKEEFQFDGYFLKPSDIVRVVVKQTERTARELSDYENNNMSEGVIIYVSPKDILDYDKYTKDLTKEAFATARTKVLQGSQKDHSQRIKIVMDKTKIFIVHGRDDLAKTEVARFIEKLKLKPIILHEQASAGMTIIEKIEQFSNVGYGIILYTPCDVGGLNDKGSVPNLKPRARQNVVFEHGFLSAKLGRANVCALVKGNVEIPNDISGVVYVPMDDAKAWHIALAKEMRNAGYDIDMNLII